MDRLYKRPMFRKGGSAGEGITSGLQRQGYKDPAGSVIQNDPTKVQQVGTSMEQFNKAFPQYNRANSDFLINFGLDLASRPSAGPGFGGLLTTAAQSAKEPFLQMQKTNMANTQGQRELALQFWKSMDADDKDAMVKRAEQMVEAGRFKTVEEALQVLVPTYRKDQSPEESAREKILTEEGNVDDAVKKIGQQYTLGEPDASTLYTFFQDIQSGTYKGAPHHPGTFFIEDDDVGRSDKDSRLVIKDFDPNKDDYKDGRVYIDFITKIAYVKQGQFFVPYSEWSAEEIPTD
jgi:hypothetical protein